MIRTDREIICPVDIEQGSNLPPILPLGTAVVLRAEMKGSGGVVLCPAGSLGVIVYAPADNTHRYRIRLPGGEEISAHRDEIDVFRHFQRGELGTPPRDQDLSQYVIYRCVIGSRAYGLASDDSDVDRRGVYLPPAEMQWSLFGVPEQLENQDTDECYWELQKFLVLALKANPNVLEVLHSPIVEYATPLAQELLGMRRAFLSKLVYQTYNGYVMSQFKKIEQDVRTRGEVRWKHAMHLIRLLLSGVTVLRSGILPVAVTEHRDRLLAIRKGEVSWDGVNRWRLDLHKEFDAAFQSSPLPDRPDYEAANAFLIKARRSTVN